MDLAEGHVAALKYVQKTVTPKGKVKHVELRYNYVVFVMLLHGIYNVFICIVFYLIMRCYVLLETFLSLLS